MSPYVVLVTGDRNWKHDEVIVRAIGDIWRVKDRKGIWVTFIHGGARGADTIAEKIARELGFEVVVYEAKWGLLGKFAGIDRNREMLEKGKPNLVLAFHDNLFGDGDQDVTPSKGTKHMVEIALKSGIPVAHWTSDGRCQWYGYTLRPAAGKLGNTLPGV
jgi:hypothetical protein